MMNFLRQLFLFQTGRSLSRGAARMIGLGRFATILGLLGGYRYLRRHAR